MMAAMRLEQPDRVPVCPDISNMIPCRLTGKPFWDIYLNQDPPIWKAYIEAVRYFGFDGCLDKGPFRFLYEPGVSTEENVVSRTDERIVKRIVTHTPAGDLEEEVTCYRADSPTYTEMPVKDIVEDFEELRYLLRPPTGYDASEFEASRREMGEDGIVCIHIGVPGFQNWFWYIDGGLEALTYAWYDHHDLMLELRDLEHERILRQCAMALDVKPDVILTGGSGILVLQSPEIFRETGLSTLADITRMCKEAGVLTMVHSGGPTRDLVEMCVDETELNCIKPLEVPPQGDCELRAFKQDFGDGICLMGNLHTTEVMWKGTPADVEAAARQAIDDAAEGGGFILSTGDQCGRDTPDENLFAMIEEARSYGTY